MDEKEDIFLEYFEECKKNLRKFCFAKLKRKEDSEDLFQDTIEQAFKNFDNIKDKKAYLSYLFTIADRLLKHKWKSDAKLKKADNSNLDSLISYKTYIGYFTGDLDLFMHILYQLPEKQRKIFYHIDYLGFDISFICTIMNMKAEAVKKNLYRGRKKFKKLLMKEILSK